MTSNVLPAEITTKSMRGPRCQLPREPKGRDVLEAPERLVDVWLSIGEHCRYQDISALCAANKGFSRLKLLPPFQRLLLGKLPQLAQDAAGALQYVRNEPCKPISHRWLQANKPLEREVIIAAYQAAMVVFFTLNGTYNERALMKAVLVGSIFTAITCSVLFIIDRAAVLGERWRLVNSWDILLTSDALVLVFRFANAIVLDTSFSTSREQGRNVVNSPLTGLLLAWIAGAIGQKKLYEDRWAMVPQPSPDRSSDCKSREITAPEIHQYRRLLAASAALEDIVDATGNLVHVNSLTEEQRAILSYCAHLAEAGSLPTC